MTTYNFEPRFAPLILSGAKFSTIRRTAAVVGSTAHLFTGMRTKDCQRLGAHEIIACRPIMLGRKDNGQVSIKLGARQVSLSEMMAIALGDGFHTPAEMVSWFEKTYDIPTNYSGCAHDVFSGFQITWSAF